MPTPPFILELRRFIGSRPLWLSGSTAVVLRPGPDETEILLVKRSDNGRWTPVSGIVDPGEHPAAAALREVEEEAGVRAEIERLCWLTVTDMVTYDNGDQTQYIDHVFRCRWLSGEPYPADGEASQAAFFPLSALPELDAENAERIRTALRDEPTTLLS